MFCSKQQPDQLSFEVASDSITDTLPSSQRGPYYYKRGNGDAWDFIRGQELNFHLGNAVKYIVRAGYKDDKASDLRKAIHYLQNELEHTTTASEGVPHFLLDHELEEQSNPRFTEEADNRGVQGIFS